MVVESEEEEEKVRLLTESASATPVRVIDIVSVIDIVIFVIVIVVVIVIVLFVIVIIVFIMIMIQVRRGSAAVVRPSEESATSSNLPRAGWQVNIHIHTFIILIIRVCDKILSSGRCQRPLLAASSCGENLPRNERSSHQCPQFWARQALL